MSVWQLTVLFVSHHITGRVCLDKVIHRAANTTQLVFAQAENLALMFSLRALAAF